MTGRRAIAGHSAQLLTIRGTRVAAQLAVMALTARWFGPEAAGRFALALAITAPVFVLADLGLRTLYLSRAPRPPFAYVLRLRLLSTALAVAVCAVVALLRPQLAPVIVAVTATKVADLLIDTSIGPVQLRGRLWWATAITVAGTATMLALYVRLSGLGFAPALLVASLAGSVILCVASVAVGVLASREVESSGASHRVTGGLLRDGIAVGVSLGMLSLATALPQYMLAAVYSPVVSGRYAVMIYLVVAGEMLMNAIGQAGLPHLVDRRESGGLAALSAVGNRYLLRGTLAALPAAVLAVAAGAVVIPAVMGPVYAFAWTESAVLVVMLTLLPALFTGSVVLQAMNLYRATAAISAGALLLVAVCTVLLVPVLGVTGALMSAAAGTALRIALAQRRWRTATERTSSSTAGAVSWSS